MAATNAFIGDVSRKPQLHNYCDEFYYDVKLVDTVKKIGVNKDTGEDDYVIVKKEVVTKTSIKELIESQADDVGLDNILKKFAVTGDTSILPENVVTNGDVIDYSAMPQDLIEAGQYFKTMKDRFDALPDELKKGRSFNDFMSTFNQNEFNAYIAGLEAAAKVNTVKENTPKEGDK